jgi:DNA-directed RNA polymerase subunit RPC12/RpoP
MGKHDDMFSSLGFGLTIQQPKKKCSVCNSDFKPIEENHYVARDNRVASNMFGEPKEYDAYDCVICGAQIIIGERKISKTFKEV